MSKRARLEGGKEDSDGRGGDSVFRGITKPVAGSLFHYLRSCHNRIIQASEAADRAELNGFATVPGPSAAAEQLQEIARLKAENMKLAEQCQKNQAEVDALKQQNVELSAQLAGLCKGGTSTFIPELMPGSATPMSAAESSLSTPTTGFNAESFGNMPLDPSVVNSTNNSSSMAGLGLDCFGGTGFVNPGFNYTSENSVNTSQVSAGIAQGYGCFGNIPSGSHDNLDDLFANFDFSAVQPNSIPPSMWNQLGNM